MQGMTDSGAQAMSGGGSGATVAGWVVAVLLEPDRTPPAVRHFYAVGFEDRGKAEWTAVDHALRDGAVATSPQDGQEPVQTMSPIPAALMARLGLGSGEVRALGPLWPRRWIVAGQMIARR